MKNQKKKKKMNMFKIRLRNRQDILLRLCAKFAEVHEQAI